MGSHTLTLMLPATLPHRITTVLLHRHLPRADKMGIKGTIIAAVADIVEKAEAAITQETGPDIRTRAITITMESSHLSSSSSSKSKSRSRSKMTSRPVGRRRSARPTRLVLLRAWTLRLRTMKGRKRLWQIC